MNASATTHQLTWFEIAWLINPVTNAIATLARKRPTKSSFGKRGRAGYCVCSISRYLIFLSGLGICRIHQKERMFCLILAEK